MAEGELQSLKATAVIELGWNITMWGLEKKHMGFDDIYETIRSSPVQAI
jgi:hypothetical protein